MSLDELFLIRDNPFIKILVTISGKGDVKKYDYNTFVKLAEVRRIRNLLRKNLSMRFYQKKLIQKILAIYLVLIYTMLRFK